MTVRGSKLMVDLYYLGCSAFIVSDGSGTLLGIDFWTKGAFAYAEDTPEDLGLEKAAPLTALLISHDHKDHCFVPEGVQAIQGVVSRKVDDSLHFADIGGIKISKYASRHFATSARHPKMNAVFVLDVDGIRIVHLGDAHGTMANTTLLEELKEKVGNLDILLIPIGSPSMKPVGKNILMNTINILEPQVSFPMHYWSLAWKAETLSELEKSGCTVNKYDGNRVGIRHDELPPINSKTIWSLSAGKFRE